MKQKHQMIMVAATAACISGLGSCVYLERGNEGEDGSAISFSVPSTDNLVSGDSGQSWPESKAAVDDNVLPDGSSFSVWGGYYDDSGTLNATNVFNGVEVTNTNGTWSYEGTRYWIPGKTYNFYAVYPATLPSGATASCSEYGILSITNFDASATGANAIDLMTASRTSLSGDIAPTVSLSFSHELAKIKITITSEGDALTISDTKLYNINYGGTMDKSLLLNNSEYYAGKEWINNMVAGKINPPFESADITLSTVEGLSANPFGEYLLLPPQLLSADATLEFSYIYEGEATEHPVTLKLKTDNVEWWGAGQSYHYQIYIPQNDVDVSLEVTITDWNEQNFTVTW